MINKKKYIKKALAISLAAAMVFMTGCQNIYSNVPAQKTAEESATGQEEAATEAGEETGSEDVVEPEVQPETEETGEEAGEDNGVEAGVEAGSETAKEPEVQPETEENAEPDVKENTKAAESDAVTSGRSIVRDSKSGIYTEDLEFHRDDLRIVGKAYIADPNQKKPTVIFSHGLGSNFRVIENHGEKFAKEGINCIFFDFCGGSTDSLSDGSIYAMTVRTEELDLISVISDAGSLPYVDSDKLFLAGESMGGLVTALVAADYPQFFKGLVLWYPAFVIPEDARERYSRGDNTVLGVPLNPYFTQTAMEIDVDGTIGRYPGPVMIIHGDSDELVPISYSRNAVGIYQNAQLIEIPGAGHGFLGLATYYADGYSISFIKHIVNDL